MFKTLIMQVWHGFRLVGNSKWWHNSYLHNGEGGPLECRAKILKVVMVMVETIRHVETPPVA